MRRGGPGRAGVVLAVSALVTGVSCRREDPKIRELTVKAAQADEAAQELRQAWKAQLGRLPLIARFQPRRPGPYAIPFTAEQIRFLQARVNAERDVSRRALILEALAKDKEIRDLGERLVRMKSDLPAPDVVRVHQTHYGLAMRFLRGRGIADDRARDLIRRANILDRLAPGFEVYHFLEDGVYATWVAQGGAPYSPSEFNRMAVLEEIAEARARSGRLDLALGELLAQKRSLELEVSELRIEREAFLEDRAALQGEETAHVASLNSLHYLVGERHKLERAGVVVLPLLGRSRAGPDWKGDLFDQHLDLRRTTAIQIQARDLGLERIGSVEVVPGSYLRDVHYRLDFSTDHRTVTVELVNAGRFRNENVVFAVAE